MKEPKSDRLPEQSPGNESLTQSSHDKGMEAIDAEIVEDDRVTSLVPVSNDAIFDIECLEVAERTKYFKKQPNGVWLDFFKSPWTMASMLMLLTANILIGFGQWNRSSTVTAVRETSETPTSPTSQPQAESGTKNVDLAAQKSDRLNLHSLSLVNPGDKTSTTAIAPNMPTAPAQMPVAANANQQQVVAGKGTSSNLSQALLPPSLQPQQTVQNYSVPPSLVIAPPPAPSQQTQTLPLSPPPQPVSQGQQTMQTVPTLSENPDPIAEFSQRHAAEQRRLEGENLPAPTLFQQTRSEGIAKQYQIDPNNVTRQYQQMQQQQVPSSSNGDSANQQPVPNNVSITNNAAPTQTNGESTYQQQPTPNNAPPASNAVPAPDNGPPSVRMQQDGSVEIRSNSLR